MAKRRGKAKPVVFFDSSGVLVASDQRKFVTQIIRSDAGAVTTVTYEVGTQLVVECQSPPLNAQFLLDLFISQDVCEALLGDLHERYQKKLARLGKTRADWWYRKQVATSLWPLVRSAARRVSVRTVRYVFVFVLRLIGFPSLADALRTPSEKKRNRMNN